MRYLGGKSRLAKKIVGVIKARAPETLGVCEPFMGGGEHRKAATSQPGLERKSAIDRLYEVDP